MEVYVKRGVDQSHPIGGLSREMSQLLRNRGIQTPEEAEQFLHPEWSQMHDPMSMKDMDRAMELIRTAMESGWKVQVYGDYDVDGVCATTVLVQTFRRMGINCAWRIPSRHEEGYGLNMNAVEEMAREFQLLITVDCGITSAAEVKRARELGMKVIVSDHHAIPEELPDADAVLNPLLGTYACRRLCGAGVALKIVQALMAEPWAGPLLGPEWDLAVSDVAALATVADIVPLVGENRIIVHRGMREMSMGRRPGLKALMDVAGVKAPVSSSDLGYALGPRINAGGRLESAGQCVDLLLTEDPGEAGRIARHLEENNQRRQKIETDVVAQASRRMQECTDFYSDVCLVIEGEGWENGVIGLAAGKLCERYHMPVIVISVQGDTAVGSCRSVDGVNIHRMLTACQDLLVRFGGHELAAGLTILTEQIPAFREKLNRVIRETCDLRSLIPVREYDLPLDLKSVSLDLARELKAMEPFGNGNPPPMFYLHDAHVQMMRAVGRMQNHLQLEVSQDSEVRKGIAFGLGRLAGDGLRRVDALFTPEINEFRGQVQVQLQVRSLRGSSMNLPEGDRVFMNLLQEIAACSSKSFSSIPETRRIRLAAMDALQERGRGLLVIAHDPELARQVLSRGIWDVCAGAVTGEIPFNTLLLNPDPNRLRDAWEKIVFLDGDAIPGEMAWIAEKCPRAELLRLDTNENVIRLIASMNMDVDALRELYRDLYVQPRSLDRMPEMEKYSRVQQVCAICVFSELGLVKVEDSGFCRMLPMHKVDLTASPLLKALRAAAQTVGPP